MTRILAFLWGMALSLFVVFAPLARAESSEGTPFIKHTTLKPEELPTPGKPLKLWVALNKTRSVDLRIRAFISLDGNLMDIPLSHPTYNEADELVFSAEVPSPLEKISYQFFAYAHEKKVEASKRFYVERQCIPLVALPKGDVPADVSREGGIETLLNQTTGLKREIDLLNQSCVTLEKLKSLLKE